MFGLSYFLLGRIPDIEFMTALSVDECRKRLRQELQRKRKFFGLLPPPPIVERLKGDRFLISSNQSFFYRDNFLVLDGQLSAAREGTLIRAAFRLYEGTSIILILGFAVFFGMAANDVIANGAEPGLLLIPIVLLGLLALVLRLASWLSRSKRDRLAVYLQSLLKP